jgi:hypothetical protein
MKGKKIIMEWARKNSSRMILDGWVDGCKSWFKDCVPTVKNLICVVVQNIMFQMILFLNRLPKSELFEFI